MLLTLHDRYGNEKAELSPGESSTQDKEVQADNVLSLTFTLYEYVGIDVNDYVDFEGERYWAIERYQPQEKSTVEWAYNVQLYGIESLMKRFLVLKNTDGENEAVFTLTARPIDHLRLIVQCINDGMDHTTNWKVGEVTGTDNVVIDYEGKYCDEALKELAEAVGAEWWIDGETVNLSRCEWGSPVVLGYGEGLTSLDRDTADNAKFYTRLFPIGSSRNIDRERYGATRLQLPGGAKYVDIADLVEQYGVVHHYEQETFSGIYPRRVGVVSSVRSEEVTDTDGSPFTIWYFKDDGLTFDPNDHEIGGLVKRVSFQEGSELAGLGADDGHYFEVNYDSETKEFELVTIWPYDDDTQLPGGTLVPKVGDKYILWNIRMPDEYYGLAEAEFRTAVDAYNAQHTQDVSRYKAPTDHVWIEDTGTALAVGRRVRLKSAEYFPKLGYRESRITRISRKVTLPSQMDLVISDALSTGALAKIDDAISDARSYTSSVVGALNVPDVIKSWETTKPTDTNIFSARRSLKEFVSKIYDDVVQGLLTLRKGAWFGAFSKGSSGAAIDAEGNAEVEGLTVRRGLAVGRGFGIGEDGTATLGSTTTRDITNAGDLTTKDLHVTGSAHFFELIIDQIRSAGGAVMLTGANGFRVAAVKKLYDGKLYYEITYSLTFCRATTAPAQIAEDGTATVVLASPDGSVHPSSVQVTGATARSYDAATGTLVLAKATGAVTVTAWCYYLRYSLGQNDWFDNKRGWVTPDYMAEAGTAYIKVIPKEGYAMPAALQNVRQCTIDSYTPSTGEMVVSHPTGSDRQVYLTFWAERQQTEPQTFAITYVLEGVEAYLLEYNGEAPSMPAPTTITEGGEQMVCFIPDDYLFYPDPEDVTVTGADYEYDQPTGELILRNPTGPVTITATGSRYLVEFSLNLEHLSVVEDLSAVYAGEYMLELTLVADEGYRLPEQLAVSGGLDEFDWDPTTGVLVIENPYDIISIDGEAEVVEEPEPTVYAVTYALTNLVVEAGIDELAEDTQATVILSAPTGYRLPETVAVAGATLVSWNAQTGTLAIANPTGPVTVTAVGTAQQQEEDWYATDALVLHLDGIDNGGRDVHLDSATAWKDLSAQGHDATSVSGAAVAFGATYAQFSSTAIAAAVGLAADSAWTVEYVPKYGADFGNQFAAGYWANPYIIGMGRGRLRVNNASGGIVYNNNGIGNHHGLAFTWEPGTGLKVYKDGALLAEVSSTAAMRAVPTLWLGYQADARSYAAGSVHALRVYARALTAAEVAANHALDAERFDF